MSHSTDQQQTAAASGRAGGGTGTSGFLNKLRGQAEQYIHKIPAMDELQHSVRQGYVANNPRQSPHTLQIQLAVKGQKGVIIDADALARETKSFSKNILDLVRLESPDPNVIDTADIQDVGDRIAFLTYKTGELYKGYAARIETARSSFKDIRNHEHALNAQRDRKAQLEREIGKLRINSKPDTSTQTKLAQLQGELDALAGPQAPLTNAEVEAMKLKRRKLVEAFDIEFDALQELGEKLAIIANYGKTLVNGWDISSSKVGQPESYVDGARTAAIRSGLENDLSAWSSSKAYVPRPDIGSSVRGGDTSSLHAPSFHDSHREELASITTDVDPIQAHNEALDSYYQTPSSPPPLPPRHTSDQSGASYGTASSETNVPGAFPAAIPIAGASGVGAGSVTSPLATSGAPPLVQQINTAPVTDLPGSALNKNPFYEGHSSPAVTYASAEPIDTFSPPSSAYLDAGLPTVAETGSPIVGTGGPSSGVLPPPATSVQSSAPAPKSKEQEAREDLDKRFAEYSGHSTAAGASAEEQLPAYENPQGTVPQAEKASKPDA